MKKEKTKLNKVSLWGQTDHSGHFLVTVSSVTAWLYSKDSKLANEFVEQTDRILLEIRKERKEREQKEKNEPNIKEFEKMLKKIENAEIDIKLKKKKPWFKFW